MSVSYYYLLALGSNTGDRSAHMERATARLAGLPGARLVDRSPVIETAPLRSDVFDVSDHEPYLNALIVLESPTPPSALHPALLAIEDELGHARDARWRPRAMDIDVLYCSVAAAGQSTFPADGVPCLERTTRLCVPHPHFRERPFLIALACGEKDAGLGIPDAALTSHEELFSALSSASSPLFPARV